MEEYFPTINNQLSAYSKFSNRPSTEVTHGHIQGHQKTKQCIWNANFQRCCKTRWLLREGVARIVRRSSSIINNKTSPRWPYQETFRDRQDSIQYNSEVEQEGGQLLFAVQYSCFVLLQTLLNAVRTNTWITSRLNITVCGCDAICGQNLRQLMTVILELFSLNV